MKIVIQSIPWKLWAAKRLIFRKVSLLSLHSTCFHNASYIFNLFFVAINIRLFIYLWCPFFTLMRIRISIRIRILLIKLCESATTGLHTLKDSIFEPPCSMASMALHSSIWASKLLNVDFNSDLDPAPAFLSNADPGQDTASRNNSDACGSGSATLTRIIPDYICTMHLVNY